MSDGSLCINLIIACHTITDLDAISFLQEMQRMLRTIHAAAEAIRQGQVTPLDLLDQCLKQIDRYEEKIKAWVFVNREEAREQAARLTAELRAGRCRGPL